MASRDPTGHGLGQTGGQGATLPQQRGSLAWRRGHLRARLGTPHHWLVIFILSPSLLLPPFLLPLLLLTTAHPHLLSLFAPGQLAGEELVVS